MKRRASRQLVFGFRAHGGARSGAGRPPTGVRSGVSHLRRAPLSRRHPVHITLRLARGFPSLRRSRLFRAVRAALAAGRERFGFRLIHFSVQNDHLHLLAEVVDRRALTRGVQGLTIRVARAVNRRLERRGGVFGDRYHARPLRTPREVRLALRYVLNNVRKHAPAQSACGHIDDRSSAPWFDGWNRPAELVFGRPSETGPPVVAPRTWLLRVGWRRAGAIDVDDAPSG